MQAVVKIGSSQYLIQPGLELLVDKPEIEEVLLSIGDDGEVFIKQGKVTIKDLGQEKGDKVRIFKYKAKSRYKKTRGFRPTFHKIKIEKIDIREKKA